MAWQNHIVLFHNFKKDKDLSKYIWTVWIFVAQMLTFRLHIGIFLEEFFWHICIALGQSWILLAPNRWQHFTSTHLTHKHAELRIISKVKNVEKELPKFVPTQGSCLLSCYSTKHISPGDAINSLGENIFKIPYLHTSIPFREQKCQFAHNSCSGSYFSLWAYLSAWG